MIFSFKSLFAIWSLSPQQFHYYFCFSIVSWQYQKYSTILIVVLCLLCVTMMKNETERGKEHEERDKKKAHRGQSVRYRSWWKQGNIEMAMSEDHAS